MMNLRDSIWVTSLPRPLSYISFKGSGNFFKWKDESFKLLKFDGLTRRLSLLKKILNNDFVYQEIHYAKTKNYKNYF